MAEKMVLSPTEKADVSSVNSIVQALYHAVSFLPGRQPDYARLRALFHPDGRLSPPRGAKESHVKVMDVETFITRSREYVVTMGMEKLGFHEKEIARRTETFGHIVHVFSTYESRHRETDTLAIQRGINSIQIVRDGIRWWVISILWDVEQPNTPIPEMYLPSA